MKRPFATFLVGLLGLVFLGVLLYSCGCAERTFKVHGPGGCIGEIKQDPNCDPPVDHFPDGKEVHCHIRVMTEQGLVDRDRIIVYHCIKAKL